jgi:RNA polymerase sigma-70 factor (ECF subfamily)
LQELSDPATAFPEEPAEEVASLYHRALELVRGEFEERSWQMFWRVAVDGHEVGAIAADLGVSPAAVRKAKSRVLLRLRQEVGELIDIQAPGSGAPVEPL